MLSTQNKFVHVYYDFDYVPEKSSYNNDSFIDQHNTNYNEWHAKTCIDYGVPPVFDLKQIIDNIESRYDVDVTYESLDDEEVSDAIYDITGWCVVHFEVVDVTI